jgi:hypothetical protein
VLLLFANDPRPDTLTWQCPFDEVHMTVYPANRYTLEA